MKKISAHLIQAPFTQLNSPYPAIYYLRSFLEKRGTAAYASDLAISTFRSIFSRAGMEKVFADGEKALLAGKLDAADQETRDNLVRYLSNARAYAECVEPMVDFLSGKAPDFRHMLQDPDRLPNGFRVERYLEETEDPPLPEVVASLCIEDLADFITFSLDPDFALVRYAESKAASQPRFSEIRRAVEESYVIREFVRPEAARLLDGRSADLACVSVPFPGCLAPALAILEEAKRRGMRTAMGGGYVSTELRFIKNSDFFDTVDFLCFDGGFGSLASIVDSLSGKNTQDAACFRTMRKAGKAICVEGFPADSAPDYPKGGAWERIPCPAEDAYAGEERDALGKAFPDYSGVDLGLYPRMHDSGNPMHALWSNGAWLKCRLAYGCYWGKCSFCDGTLDYIGRFRPCDARELYAHMRAQAAALGANGVHFVDEAAPVPLLLSFARENARAGRPLSFWGNTRFEPLFTQDRAEFLSWAGFLAASAGIEVAGERGLSLSAKGLAMADIVYACDSLSRAGVLVHAYLMHGLPGQTEADLVDSLEILKQMFRLGLVHSAFWHPFVLTRHSPLYRKMAGSGAVILPDGDFALNDLDWRGSGSLARYAPGIESALESYMAGEGWEAPASTWFDFAVPAPRVDKDYVKALRNGERKKADKAPMPASSSAAWLAGRPIAEKAPGGKSLVRWSHRNSLAEISLEAAMVPRLIEILDAADPRKAVPPSALAVRAGIETLGDAGGDACAVLRGNGLVFI